MHNGWEFFKAIVDGDPLLLNGVNIWAEKWLDTKEMISVKDPIYGQPYNVPIYELEKNQARFGAIEFSNCVWGIYLPKEGEMEVFR